jgi:hypothetical protein
VIDISVTRLLVSLVALALDPPGVVLEFPENKKAAMIKEHVLKGAIAPGRILTLPPIRR